MCDVCVDAVYATLLDTELCPHREGAFVFQFQATDRHAGLATIHCQNDITNTSVKISVKPIMSESLPPPPLKPSCCFVSSSDCLHLLLPMFYY